VPARAKERVRERVPSLISDKRKKDCESRGEKRVSVQQNLDSFCWPLFPYWEWLHSSIVLLTYLPFAGFD
jgi:hypothetical protein